MRTLALLLSFLCLSPWCWAEASRNFDGTNDEIDFGNTLDVTTGDISDCAWWKGTESAAGDFILGKKANVTDATAGYALTQQSTDVTRWRLGDGTNGMSDAGTTDTDGAWFFLCGTWSGTNVAILYENGVQVDTDSTPDVGSLTTTSNLQMGEDNSDTTDANGLIAYGMVYGTSVLTVNEVNELMWRPEAIPTNLAGGVKGGLWPLWGASPEQDLSGNGRTGTVSGSAGLSSDGPPVIIGDAPI